MNASCLKVRAWGVLCDPWIVRQCAYGRKGLWTGQAVKLAVVLARPVAIPSTHFQTPACFSRGARCNVHDMALGASDSRHQTRKNSRWPHDFRHKEALWPASNSHKPAWVDWPLATVDARMELSALPWSLASDPATDLLKIEKRLSPDLVKELCHQGQVQGAVEVLEALVEMNLSVDKHLLYSVLKESVVQKDLTVGGQVHALALRMGLRSDTFLCNHFIRMYAGHGKLQEATDVFRGVALPDAFMCSSIISAHVKQGQAERAVELYRHMRAQRMKPDGYVLVAALQACTAAGDLQSGKQVHGDALTGGMEHDMFVCNCLVDMYAKCGSLEDARRVFDGLADKDVVTWNAMIAGYAKVEGMGQEALDIYSAMHNQGMIAPNAVTFVALLQACANVGVPALDKGKQFHLQVRDRGLESDLVVGGSLVNMYVKCGSLRDARGVFDGLGEKNVVSWTAMIAGYAQQQSTHQEALNLCSVMLREGMVAPNAVTFACLLQACASVGVPALETGKQLHSQLKDRGLDCDAILGGSLVNMYVKCGSLKDARCVFDSMGDRNVLNWNAMIAGYAKVEGMSQEALDLYTAMHDEGLTAPNAVTFIGLLLACANLGVPALEKGKRLHSQLQDRGLESDVVVGGSLVNMYVKCGSLGDARIVFDGLGEKDVVTWTAMIAGYAPHESMAQEALYLYSAMLNEGLSAPDAVTFACLLQACGNVGVPALETGKQLHSRIKDQRLESDAVVGGSLVNMYVKCGSLKDARCVFNGMSEKSVATWNAMIAGYAKVESMGQEALSLYKIMRSEHMVAPNSVTYGCLLQACANVGVSALEMGKQLHSQLKDSRLDSDAVIGGGLVNMYVKCGNLMGARTVFDRLKEKNVVTWTAMIAGYVQHESMGQEALNIYGAMRNEGLTTPDAVTFVCLLEACTSVGALQQGKQLHSEIRTRGLESNVLVGTCLVKMYAKCGSLKVSREVFDRLPEKNLVTWTALLKGYAEHGEGATAIQCFEELLEQGIQPDEVAYTCLFTACSHAGLVDQGQHYFETMLERHGVEPNEHVYCCMVDLLGRSGHLHRAEEMLRASGLVGSSVCWTALLSACKSHGDAELGRRCFDHLVTLEPDVATAYVLLGSIYADTGRWDDVDKVEGLRKASGARKVPGKACIEVKKEVHEFTVGEERSDVAATLKKINTRVKQGGHVPQTQLVLRTMSEQEKEDALCGHAEKLALAYGLLNTPHGSTLVVIKNLRMCNDCHSSTKVMSRLEKREIVVRDGHKVHRFQNGACSCQDRP